MTNDIERSKYLKTQRQQFPFRSVIIFFFVLAMFSATSCAPRIPSSNDATKQALPLTSLTFLAEADAQASEANPNTNYGTATYLQVDGAADPDVESFIRFTVSGISGDVQNAKLRVYDSTNASNDGPAVYATDTSWTESALTWKTRPARISKELDNKGNISVNTWVEYDVTSQVKGNGTFSFVLAADSSDAATFSSRQGGQPPQLVIATTGGQTLTPTVEASATETMTETATATETATLTETPTAGPSTSLTFPAEADARVKQTSPTTNYGNATTLQVDDTTDPDLESYLRFTVTGVSGPVQSARLRLYALDNGTKNGPAVYASDPAWDEKTITWKNARPVQARHWITRTISIRIAGWNTMSHPW